jgi:hypothetical protein
MFGNDPAVLADHDAVSIGLDLNGPPDRARFHRVLVVVEAHQTGLGDRGRDSMEAVEPTRIRHEIGSLGLEDLAVGDRCPARRLVRSWKTGLRTFGSHPCQVSRNSINSAFTYPVAVEIAVLPNDNVAKVEPDAQPKAA